MAEARHIPHGFEPVFDGLSRVLILGSFPSVLSRENDFYYGNPRNRFWQVIAQCLERETPQFIPEKTALLLQGNIALWDVISSCDIAGSSDASIRNARPVDIMRIFEAAPIEAVFCNGATAARLYARHLQPVCGMPATTLPSTSPANAAWSLPRLADRWNDELSAVLRDR